ncbi:MAG TPA: SGNH/GDSL hydrolase family protein [Ornithinibacter sp.]|nr:SGNH/GDSL hydrolase family protein [Ornithinibacter sp.]
MTRSTLPILAAASAIVLALSGCSGDPERATAGTAAATSAVPAPSPTASDAVAPAQLYVALGDSLAAGYQPGGAELRDTAYPALTANRLEAAGAALEVENLGCSGETTTSLIEGGTCTYAEGSQLEQAEAVLAGRSGEVALVTIDIGGNDLLRCVRGGAAIDTACVTEGVQTVEKNLPTILERLRTAAGPDAPVLVLGYYNPWVAAQTLDQPVTGVDEAARAYADLSDGIEAAANSAGATFVGLDEAFATDDTTPTELGGRTVPENAARVCTLTNLCTGRDIHFSDEGAATVARVLAEAATRAGVTTAG